MDTQNMLNNLTTYAAYSNDFNELFNLLLHTDETDRIEAKEAAQSLGKSFLETVSAFSNEPNLGGGYILLGVSKNKEAREPRYTVKGVTDPDTLQQQIASQCCESFNITICPIIKVIPHGQGTLILVHIPEAEGHEKPVFIKSKGLEHGAYRRIGSTDQTCTREDFDLIYRLRSKQKFDASQLENASFEDFDPVAIQTYRTERKDVKSNAKELAYSDLDLLKAVQAITTEKGATHPTAAGILLFGKHMALRRFFLMQNHIDFLLVEGTEWVSDSKRRFTALEINEALYYRNCSLQYEIMNSIPQIFALHADGLKRRR